LIARIAFANQLPWLAGCMLVMGSKYFHFMVSTVYSIPDKYEMNFKFLLPKELINLILYSPSGSHKGQSN
jgi:hypothetical protein